MSSGGGGAAGTVVLPAYIEAQHKQWLDDNGADVLVTKQSLVNYMRIAFSSVNPYNSVLAYNPTSDLVNARTQLASLETAVNAISTPEAQYGEFVGAAEMELARNTNPLFGVEDISGLASNITSDVLAALSGVVADIGGDIKVDVNDTVSAALAKIPAASASVTEFTTIANEAEAESSRTTNKIFDIDLTSIVGTVTADVLNNLDNYASSIAFDTQLEVDNFISSALNKVAAVIASAPITTMISDFTTREELVLLRSASRFSAGMADINAVMGSAFVFGHALIEAEHQTRISEFTVGLTMRVLELTLGTYQTLGASIFAEVSATARGTIDAYVRGYIQEQITKRSAKAEYEQTIHQTIAQLIMTKISAVMTIYGGTYATEFAAQSENIRNSIILSLDKQSTTIMQNKQNKVQYELAAIGAMSGILGTQISGYGSASLQSTQIEQLAIASGADEVKQNTKFAIEDVLWDINIFKQASPILAAPLGAAYPIPEKPSEASSIASGALTGFAVAGPAGALAGAVGGGLLDLLKE